MSPRSSSRHRQQAGFTLIEVAITAAIGAVVMGALTSVILTSVRASNIASSRVEASAQIRNFEAFAYDDFAGGQVQGGSGCTQASPCTTQPLVITGSAATNSAAPVISPYQITYVWDGSAFLDRQVASTGTPTHTATDVSSFSWYVDTSSAAFPIVIVAMTVTVQSYSQSQTFLFYPRLG